MIRTRFAPSPTGHLHIGGARTALYSWLYARKHSGQFILRVEDTDQERSTQEYTQAIIEGMQWLNLDYDEGPFYQTQRMERYKGVLQQLLNEGKAYRCYCSKDRLETLRTQQLANKEKPRYDGHCRDLDLHDPNQPYVIRFRTPQTGEVVFTDQVYGTISFANAELDDLILARSDGMPTYNFCVVVDDWDMRITHVIRGDDHINNTPRQIHILNALGASVPVYTHVPMILGSDGKRLSKRHGATSVLQYRDEGYLPEALLNYLVRLGWSHGDQEVFTREEMLQHFSIENINRAPAAFNIDKLLWLNQHYLKTLEPEYVAQHLSWHMDKLGIKYQQSPALAQVVTAQAERSKTLAEMAEKSAFFYQNIQTYDQAAVNKHFTPDIQTAFAETCKKLASLTEWKKEVIHQVIIDCAETFDVKLGKLAQPIRIAVTGTTVSPPIDITLELLGQIKTLERLKAAEKFFP